MKFNNELNELIYNKLPHTFSYCDIDGVGRWNNSFGISKRLVLIEKKHAYEKLSKTQKETLDLLNRVIRWELFDDMSGIYFIEDVPKHRGGGYNAFNITKCFHTHYKNVEDMKSLFIGDENEEQLIKEMLDRDKKEKQQFVKMMLGEDA